MRACPVSTRTPVGGSCSNSVKPLRIVGSSSGIRPSLAAERAIACSPVPCARLETHGGRPPSNVK
jgi:hypothetical protein